MKAIIDALNVVYDEKEKRSFVKLNLLSLLFTLVAILSLMIALAAVVIGRDCRSLRCNGRLRSRLRSG